jgi:hypothetical protein
MTSFMLSAPTLCSTAKVQVTTDRKGRDDLANQGGKPMAVTDQQPAAALEWLNLDAATPPAIRNRRAKALELARRGGDGTIEQRAERALLG